MSAENCSFFQESNPFNPIYKKVIEITCEPQPWSVIKAILINDQQLWSIDTDNIPRLVRLCNGRAIYDLARAGIIAKRGSKYEIISPDFTHQPYLPSLEP